MYKVIVAGGRSFNDYELLKKELLEFLKERDISNVEIVSGGADSLGEKFAKEIGCSLKVFEAKLDLLGRSAGVLRNSEMGKYADACIVFMEKGGAKGSLHIIPVAERRDLDLKIVKY